MSMSDITKAIHKARPSLKEIAPLTDAIIKSFGVFNILLGLSLFQLHNIQISPTLAVVNSFFSYRVWGVIFILLGVIKLIALRKNNWELLRKTLITAVFVKAVWFFALIVQILAGQGTIAVTILWAFVTVVQVYTYIHFAPTHYHKRGATNGSKQR